MHTSRLCTLGLLSLPLLLSLTACDKATTSPDAAPEPLVGTAASSEDEAPKPPVADLRPVSDSYHGVEVIDPYRWLEDANDEQVLAWREGQDEYARAVLEAQPSLPELEARVAEIMNAPTLSHWGPKVAPSGVFMMRHQPPAQQASLVLLRSLEDPSEAQVVVDPLRLDPEGLTHIDWFVPSPSGDKVAVSLSKGGSEIGDLHIFSTVDGKLVEDPIIRVNGGTAGGSAAWQRDGKGLYYTRYPRPGERPDHELDKYVQVHYHALGSDAAKDPHEFGTELPDIAEIRLDMAPEGEQLLATVQYGDSGRFAHYLRSPKGKWGQLSSFDDGVVQVSFGAKQLWFVEAGEAHPRGRLLRAPLRKPAKREEFVAEGEDAITTSFWSDFSVEVIGQRVYVIYQLGGPREIRAFDLRSGERVDAPTQPEVAQVSGLINLDLALEGASDTLLFGAGSYLDPWAWYTHTPKQGTKASALAEPSVVDLSAYEVRREFATSKDGTKVPVNILVARDIELSGEHPCVVTAYGGYGVSLTPRYAPVRAALLERGFCWAQANLRGGSEYGEQWHREGALTNKQNVFDDFAAVLEHMIERGYTKPERLGIRGGSNGGLLMGATFVQHPELMRAVVSQVGIYDMLRNELSPNGQFNIPEFGTVTDPEQFTAMHAYSPYHHVQDGVTYPDVLFTTGANDPRVDPMQSRKMAARMQAATAGSDTRILLRTSDDAGHGSATPLAARIVETAEVYAFLVDSL